MEESLERGEGNSACWCLGEPLGTASSVIEREAPIGQPGEEAARGCKPPLHALYLFGCAGYIMM